MILKELAIIQTGIFAKPMSKGTLVYLQSKHFDDFGQLITVLRPELNETGVSEKHLLKNGDVLFSAKGSKNFATVFEQHNHPAVASTSFFVIRIQNQVILPHYLAWVLNNSSTQALIKGKATGTSILSISKQVLENLKISVPNVEIQHIVLEISKLRDKEKSLKREIEELKDAYLHYKISKVINVD